MSTPRITLERVALVLVPLSTAVVFIALLAMESLEVRYDLQLISTSHAAPGAPVPARAFFFTPSDGIRPAEAEARPGRLAVRDEANRLVAEGELMVTLRGVTGVESPGRFGMDGWATAPTEEGDYTIVATITEEGEVIARCDAPLVVADTPRPSALVARPMMPMQQWRLGPVQTASGAVPPRALELRVRGGYCVPGHSCELLVWVGQPAASVTLEGRGLTLEDDTPASTTAGIVRRRAIVQGPEAGVTIVASREGVEVARRDVQLPIVQSGVPIGSGPSICSDPCRISYEGIDVPVLVDLFERGVWSGVATIPPRGADAARDPPTPPPSYTTELEEGLWRLQLRTDPFGVESATSHVVYVGDPSEAVEALRARLASEGGEDAFTSAMPIDDVPPADQVAFGAALLEMDVLRLPQARSGRVQEDLGLGRDRSAARWIAALFVLAVGLFVAGWVMRRGLVASAEARALMSEAGDEAATSRENVLSMTFTVAGVVLATLLAFAAAALLMLTRGV